MPKNLLLTEVLYAGGAVQEYVVIQPQTLTGWSGADASGTPPPAPYCPPDPVTTQGPPLQPPCVDVAGECIPIGKSDYLAVCGYKYIDLETGQIIELSSDTQYPLVNPNMHQWIKAEQPGSVQLRDPDTGNTASLNLPFARGTSQTVTLMNEQYEDGYDNHWDEVQKVWIKGQTNDSTIKAPQGVIQFNSDGTEDTNWEYANWEPIPYTSSPSPRTASIVWQNLFIANLRQFTDAGINGAYPTQDYKTWSLCGTVYEGAAEYGLAPNIGQYPLDPNDNVCLDCENQFIAGFTDSRCYGVNIVMAEVPYINDWMGARYPRSYQYDFRWQSYSQLTSWARYAPTVTNHVGWRCNDNCRNGTPFETWPCNCPEYGDPEAANSSKNCEWFSYNWEWNTSLVPGFGFDGWDPMNEQRQTVQTEVNYWLNRNGARWGGNSAKQGGWAFKRISACEWRIVATINTRNLPSIDDVEGVVQYTYDENGQAYAWVWSNADGWQSYGEKNYNGGNI